MKKLTIALMVLSLLATFSIVGFGADTSHNVSLSISSITAIGFKENNPNVTITVVSAGDPSQLTANAYSDPNANPATLAYLVIASSGSTMKITASLDSGTSGPYNLSVGTMSVSAQYPNSSAAGTTEADASSDTYLPLSTTNSDLITGINNLVATGTGGALLKYKVHFTDVPDPDASYSDSVTYTLTAS